MNPIPYHRLHKLHELSEAGFTELENEQNWETFQTNINPSNPSLTTNCTNEIPMNNKSTSKFQCSHVPPSTPRLHSGNTGSCRHIIGVPLTPSPLVLSSLLLRISPFHCFIVSSFFISPLFFNFTDNERTT